ncbi:MAG: hypothetical protein IPJ65_39820 [Archangiaceae bacterium]|nr:hypothetical protein [Archangiaceae bacterium]
MRVLGIVPARGGSKRLPNKNLLKLGGKELTARAIESCLGASRLADVVVSSDSEAVLEVARRYSNTRPMTPSRLSNPALR